VLDAEKKPEPAKETVVVQQMANSNASALLKRGNMALEDGEWGKADQFFEDVLNQDPECAHAYLGKFLAKVRTENVQQAFAKLRTEIEEAVTITNISVQAHESSKKEWIDQVCAEYVASGILNVSTAERLFPSSAVEFESSYSYWAAQAARSDNLEKEYPNLQRAIKMAEPAMRAELEAYVEDLKTAIYEKKHHAEAHDAEIEARSKEESWNRANQELAATLEKQKKYLEDEYQKLCREMDSTTDYWRLKSLANNFFALGNYRDSFAKASEIREKLKEQDREKEQRQKIVQRAASWISAGRCQYCGGEFKGVFGKKCAACGKPKDY
jgi:rubrerythrin